MIGGWARRAADLHAELVALAGTDDPRWWLVAGGAALARGAAPAASDYASDADPAGDTFIGVASPAPSDPAADALARARAARAAIRALDGKFPDQALAVTLRRTTSGARIVPTTLDVAAFAIGDRCYAARLDAADLLADLSRVLAGESPRVLQPLAALPTPFVTITIGDEPLETARHGHRRGWLQNGISQGPWLGLSRAGGLDIVSTCHLVLDGYAHAMLVAQIRKTTEAQRPQRGEVSDLCGLCASVVFLPLPTVWRELAAPIGALKLAYATGRLLHRPGAPTSPTFQIPVAPGAPTDPLRRARRVVPALASVHFIDDKPESFERFAARTRAAIAREAAGEGLVSRLLAAARAAPTPLAWKRRAIGATRPRWLAPIADVLGGRACVSRIRIDTPLAPACAVSVPLQADGYVITAVDDGKRAGLTLCGSGATPELLERLLALVAS